jgi:tetratricopeptide (TPR) repeat protein
MKLNLTILILAICLGKVYAQQTVFGLFRSDIKTADQLYDRKSYQQALSLYQNAADRNLADFSLHLKIARCHYYLRQYHLADKAFEKFLTKGSSLQPQDLFLYAETLCTLGDYDEALAYYRAYTAQSPDDNLVMQKIWRLSNLRYLYEDSLHYAFRPVPINTNASELCATPLANGLVFLSNRKGSQLVDKIDAATNTPFYKIFFTRMHPDTVMRTQTFEYGKTTSFAKGLDIPYHAGPLCFYDNSQKMVFTASARESNDKGLRPLQLFFASSNNGRWEITSSFPFNNLNYSLSDPSITEDGMILYFASDATEGIGGKDIYRSERIGGKWTKPVNLGDQINTVKDDRYPFYHQPTSTLYFASNGHAGMGGLDIFRTRLTDGAADEILNAGYPINTRFDDFGIVVNVANNHGYLTSNRKTGGNDDDIYEFDIDLQTYPLTLSGVLKYKEHSWSDSSDLKTFAHAKLFLIDNIRDVTLYESASDDAGNFSITIPYFSQYKLRVVGDDNEEHIVSFDIPKHKKESTEHDIVIIKDAFKTKGSQVLK